MTTLSYALSPPRPSYPPPRTLLIMLAILASVLAIILLATVSNSAYSSLSAPARVFRPFLTIHNIMLTSSALCWILFAVAAFTHAHPRPFLRPAAYKSVGVAAGALVITQVVTLLIITNLSPHPGALTLTFLGQMGSYAAQARHLLTICLLPILYILLTCWPRRFSHVSSLLRVAILFTAAVGIFAAAAWLLPQLAGNFRDLSLSRITAARSGVSLTHARFYTDLASLGASLLLALAALIHLLFPSTRRLLLITSWTVSAIVLLHAIVGLAILALGLRDRTLSPHVPTSLISIIRAATYSLTCPLILLALLHARPQLLPGPPPSSAP